MTTMADAACETNAIRDAVSQVSQPQLTSLAQSDGFDTHIQQLASRDR